MKLGTVRGGMVGYNYVAGLLASLRMSTLLLKVCAAVGALTLQQPKWSVS